GGATRAAIFQVAVEVVIDHRLCRRLDRSHRCRGNIGIGGSDGVAGAVVVEVPRFAQSQGTVPYRDVGDASMKRVGQIVGRRFSRLPPDGGHLPGSYDFIAQVDVRRLIGQLAIKINGHRSLRPVVHTHHVVPTGRIEILGK